MQLSEYLNKAKITQAEFCDRVRESGGQLSRPFCSELVAGLKRPSFETMIHIHNATGGRVSFKDFAGHLLVTSNRRVGRPAGRQRQVA